MVVVFRLKYSSEGIFDRRNLHVDKATVRAGLPMGLTGLGWPEPSPEASCGAMIC
jgi:hypothetical protein